MEEKTLHAIHPYTPREDEADKDEFSPRVRGRGGVVMSRPYGDPCQRIHTKKNVGVGHISHGPAF